MIQKSADVKEILLLLNLFLIEEQKSFFLGGNLIYRKI